MKCVFLVNLEHILHLFLVFLLLTLNKKMLAGALTQVNKISERKRVVSSSLTYLQALTLITWNITYQDFQNIILEISRSILIISGKYQYFNSFKYLRSSRYGFSMKKGVPRNFIKFTGKHLGTGIFLWILWTF